MTTPPPPAETMSAGRYKEREFQRRERAILDAALGLFDHDDWQSVTVERIADEVGIAKGTIYKHFASKEEIYARLALDEHRALATALEALPDEGSPEERIRQVVGAFWGRTGVSRALQRVIQYCARQDFQRSAPAAIRGAFAETDRRMGVVVTRILQEGIRRGRFADRPLPLLLFPAQAALTGAIEMAWGGCLEGVDADAYRDRLTSAIVAGLRPLEPAPSS